MRASSGRPGRLAGQHHDHKNTLTNRNIPCFLYYGLGKLTGYWFRWMIVGSMVSIAIVSLLTCLIPLRMGLKAIKKLEI